MPHGTPDWGLVGPKTTTYGLDDLGEHAVRLGSPHLFDRRGDVIWESDFRDGMGDVQGGVAGAGSAVGLVTGYSRQGAYAVKLACEAGAGASAWVEKRVPYPVVGGIGLEFSFSLHEDTSHWEVELGGCDGPNQFRAAVTYDWVNTRIQYRTTGGGYVPLAAGVDIADDEPCVNTIKMVADLALGVYVRLILNEAVYSMAGLPIYIWGAPARPVLRLRAIHWGVVTKTPEAYVDSIILTQNEP